VSYRIKALLLMAYAIGMVFVAAATIEIMTRTLSAYVYGRWDHLMFGCMSFIGTFFFQWLLYLYAQSLSHRMDHDKQ